MSKHGTKLKGFCDVKGKEETASLMNVSEYTIDLVLDGTEPSPYLARVIDNLPKIDKRKSTNKSDK